MISLRLAPHMYDLVSKAQSAFIKKRSIHDSFLYVKNLSTRLHKRNTPSLLFKLDIRKAFDSVRWDYIVDLLQKRGFPSRFRNWIVVLLVIASSRVLLNGVAGSPIKHGCGLRQGDPLSPLLFVLIDPISQILELASTHGLLHKIARRTTILKTSLYADDVSIFIVASKHSVQNLATILHGLGEVAGLCTNFHKSLSIFCNNIELHDILHGIPFLRTTFPLRYLGLPLLVRCLQRADFQPLKERPGGKIPTWNGKLST
jgi:hypothetical protein